MIHSSEDSDSDSPEASSLTHQGHKAHPASSRAAVFAQQGYVLEPVYAALAPLKPEDFFSSRVGRSGKDIMGRVLDGLEGLAGRGESLLLCVCVYALV